MVERSVNKRMGKFKRIVAISIILLWPMIAAAQQGVSIIDTHVHPARFIDRSTPDAFITRALRAMKEYQVEKTVLLPPPTFWGKGYRKRLPEFIEAAKAHPRAFAWGGGGEHLNPLLVSTPSDAVTAETRRRFEVAAEKLIESGIVVLGEFVAEHFSFGPHPYMSVAPDHPLLLLLADIAARHRLPVDLHMEALPADMPMPDLFSARRRGGPRTNNPTQLKANLPAFERLLAHNRAAKIVWVHARWDNTGERTVDLMRRLLADHPNLHMSIKLHRRHTGLTTPFGLFGGVQSDWLELFRNFPERFVIGSDQFYDGEPGDQIALIREFVDALPVELARKLARENAIGLYRLKD